MNNNLDYNIETMKKSKSATPSTSSSMKSSSANDSMVSSSQSFVEGRDGSKKGPKAIRPLDSIIVKDGELLKIGKRTGTMRARYYVLRDQALFIYNTKKQTIPSLVIFLKGMFINQIV